MSELENLTISLDKDWWLQDAGLNESTENTVFEIWPQNSTITEGSIKDTMISDEALAVLESVLNQWFSLLVCLIGIITNIVEIFVFTKQGFKETVNISMTCIAFWDLVRVISAAGHRLYGPVSLISPALGKTWEICTLMNLHYLHVISSNVSYMLGAYVAVERCLCVSIPFKVKLLLTAKLTTVICVVTSMLVFSSFFPLFFIYEPKWIYSEQFKTSVMFYQNTEFYKKSGPKYMEANQTFGFIYPVFSLTTMVVSTLVIAYHLRKANQSRLGLTDSHYGEIALKINNKEKQVVKMLLVIINIYIINLIPRVVGYLVMLCVPEFYSFKFYNNIFWVILYIVFVLDFLNSSVHLFIFYSMSSNFRKTFDKIFRTQTSCDK